MTEKRSMAFFMKGKAAAAPEEEVIVSKRYADEQGNPIPFVLRALPTARVDQLQDECMRPVRDKKRRGEKELDARRFSARLAIETTIFPDFRDTSLLESYGVTDPVDVAHQVLSVPGEYAEWVNAVQRVNGMDDDFEELVEEAKN